MITLAILQKNTIVLTLPVVEDLTNILVFGLIFIKFNVQYYITQRLSQTGLGVISSFS